MNFGDNLKRLRKFKKISQEKLAEKVGVSRQAVSKWETGESYPEMNNILELCKIFHCNINELVNDNILDVNSLDKEIMENVVKFNANKQNDMKSVCKVLSFIFSWGEIIFKIMGIGAVIVMFLAIPGIYSRKDYITEYKLTANASEIKIDEKGDKVSIIFNSKKMSDLKVRDVSLKEKAEEDAEASKEGYTEEELEDMKEDKYSKYESDDIINKALRKLDSKSDIEAIILVESGLLCVVSYLLLMALINKKLYQLFNNFIKGETPFTLINMKIIKFISKLFIISSCVQFVGALLFDMIGINPLQIGIQVNIVEILLVVAFTYLFQYGYELQLDSKAKMYGDFISQD